MASVAELLGNYRFQGQPVCSSCDRPAPDPEHLYEHGDGRYSCLSCIVLNVGESERETVASQVDVMIAQLRHLEQHERQAAPGCFWCGESGRFR